MNNKQESCWVPAWPTLGFATDVIVYMEQVILCTLAKLANTLNKSTTIHAHFHYAFYYELRK